MLRIGAGIAGVWTCVSSTENEMRCGRAAPRPSQRAAWRGAAGPAAHARWTKTHFTIARGSQVLLLVRPYRRGRGRGVTWNHEQPSASVPTRTSDLTDLRETGGARRQPPVCRTRRGSCRTHSGVCRTHTGVCSSRETRGRRGRAAPLAARHVHAVVRLVVARGARAHAWQVAGLAH